MLYAITPPVLFGGTQHPHLVGPISTNPYTGWAGRWYQHGTCEADGLDRNDQIILCKPQVSSSKTLNCLNSLATLLPAYIWIIIRYGGHRKEWFAHMSYILNHLTPGAWNGWEYNLLIVQAIPRAYLLLILSALKLISGLSCRSSSLFEDFSVVVGFLVGILNGHFRVVAYRLSVRLQLKCGLRERWRKRMQEILANLLWVKIRQAQALHCR